MVLDLANFVLSRFLPPLTLNKSNMRSYFVKLIGVSKSHKQILSNALMKILKTLIISAQFNLKFGSFSKFITSIK